MYQILNLIGQYLYGLWLNVPWGLTSPQGPVFRDFSNLNPTYLPYIDPGDSESEKII